MRGKLGLYVLDPTSLSSNREKRGNKNG